MSKLTWEKSQTGVTVPRWEGRLLASRIDPWQEAASWAQRRWPFINKVKSVIVLGVGGGFHVVAAAERSSAQIVVVEKERELLNAIWPDLEKRLGDRLTFVQVERPSDLRASPLIRQALGASFTVLEHPPSVATSREFYSECSSILLGREWGSLTWQWRLRGLPDFDSEPKLTRGQNALSIHDLSETRFMRESTEKEKLLLQALRELVK